MVASSGTSTERISGFGLITLRSRRVPAGAVHAYAADEFQTVCGLSLSRLNTWPERTFDGDDYEHPCPCCAVDMARRATVRPPSTMSGLAVPAPRRAADDLASTEEF